MNNKKPKSQEAIEKVIDKLLECNWKPNLKYLGNPSDLSTLMTGKHYKHYFWISNDERYAITIKTKVLTVHDSERGFCKVLSMQLKDIEFGSNYLKCGGIGLFL